MNSRISIFFRVAAMWLRWLAATCGLSGVAIYSVSLHHLGFGLLSLTAAVGCALLVPPLGSTIRRRWRAKRRGYDISSPDYREALREFAVIHLLRKSILEGAGLTLRSITVGRDVQGARTTKVSLEYPALHDDFQLTARGFRFVVSPVVRRGQTVQSIVAATEKLAANVGHQIIVVPDVSQPTRRATVEVLLRESIDYLGQPRQARDTQAWLEGESS